MEKKVLKRRIKGLLAFMLVFMMMFGSSLTVFAQDYGFNGGFEPELKVGDTISGGIKITLTTGGLSLCLQYTENGNELPNDVISDQKLSTTVAEGTWSVGDLTDNGYDEEERARMYSLRLDRVISGSADEGTIGDSNAGAGYAPSLGVPVPSNYTHTHTYDWIVTKEPTEDTDGISSYKCEGCGSITDQQPISYFTVIINNAIKSIKTAPANGTVTIDNKYLRCFSDEMIEAMQLRPDVSVKVNFIDNEVPLSFTIPAGQAPADGAEWYGYYYLGTIYGWDF